MRPPEQLCQARDAVAGRQVLRRERIRLHFYCCFGCLPHVVGRYTKAKRPDDYVWLNPKTGKPFDDIKKAFLSACEDAGIEGLVWHDLRATYGTRLGEAGFNAYDIAKLMGHANISTSQRYVRNLPVGAGEAVMLKNQRRHSIPSHALSEDSGTLMVAVNS